MAFHDELKKALEAHVPTSQLHFLDGWTKKDWYRNGWAGPGKPVALILHHTAGAATSSQDPDNKGNQHGANDGQVKYVNRHPSYGMPCSAFTLDRDGCIYVNAAYPCYHAGTGTFRGTQWSSLGVPNDSANSYCLGVECVDKGQDTTFTAAMKKSLANLIIACSVAAGWKNTGTLYVPRHKDWDDDSGKVDIRYSNDSVQGWLEEYAQHWDGVIPTYEGCMAAWENPSLANPQAWRIACRLADWGYYKGEPGERGVQMYPVKAVDNYQQDKGFNVPEPGQYGPKLHEQLWGVKP